MLSVTESLSSFSLLQIAFALTQIITKHPAQKLGVLAVGAAPGGGASNVWAYALGGDIDLSITMTFISSLAALGKFPFPFLYTPARSLSLIHLRFVNPLLRQKMNMFNGQFMI